MMKSKDTLSLFSFMYHESRTFAEIVNCAGSGAALGLLIGGAISSVTVAIPLLMPAAPVIMAACFTIGAVVGGIVGIWRAQRLPEIENTATQTSNHTVSASEEKEVFYTPESPRHQLDIKESPTKLVTHTWKKMQEHSHKKKNQDHHDKKNEDITPMKHHHHRR
jgi:hypothetical protein